MRTDFDKERYGQRWQVETVNSMYKRNYGSALRAKHYWSQCREMLLLVLTHNIAIILRLKELFYRAGLTPLVIPPKRGQTPLIPEMPGGVCPYRVDGQCSVYPYRFAGCRIFTCGGDAERENQCCETVLRRFKALCRRDNCAYRYLPLAAGLAWLRNAPAAPDHP